LATALTDPRHDPGERTPRVWSRRRCWGYQRLRDLTFNITNISGGTPTRCHATLLRLGGLFADHAFDDVTRLDAAGINTERPKLELRISEHGALLSLKNGNVFEEDRSLLGL
jgi:hypothetical protein